MDEFKKYLIANQEQLESDEPSSLVWGKVQERVKLEKPTAKVFSFRKIVQWSAAACILGLAGVGVWYLFNDKNAVKPLQEQVVTNEKKPNSAPINAPSTSTSNSTNSPISNVQSNESMVATEPSAPSAGSTQSIKSSPANNTASLSNNDKAMTVLSNMETGFTQIINLQKGKISTTPMYAESASYFNEFKAQINQLEQEEKQIKKEIAKKGLTDQQLDQLINLYQYKLTVLKQLQFEMNKTNNRYKQNRGPVDSTRAYFINI